MKTVGVLFPAELVSRAKANTARYPWAASIRDRVIQAAEPWAKLSDDELWSQMFGPGITRSWMVWSNGYCPSCKKGVEMYTWEMDPVKMPWKVSCPHCKELFPRNDFHKYYQSGLNEAGIFDPKRADRTLLFNTDHPDPKDPLHGFGVDDGEGYVDGDKRWRFIGAYLIYGQWKRMVLGGISQLAAAYVVTGDKSYAHKAAVMLDRTADLYPSFDFKAQGLVYEGPSGNGYISIWHDACEEARQLAITYDWIFDGIKDDESLPAFLSEKSREHKLSNPKASFADVQRNIEDGILREQIKNRHKIASNYPRTEITLAISKTALGWPGNRDEVLGIIDALVTRATAVDGVTGEKGMADYSAQGVMATAALLAQYTRVDPSFLKDALARHPRLYQMFRFHLDTWCLGKYYPLIGDTGWFGGRFDQYLGANFVRTKELDPDLYVFYWQLPGLDPSMFTFMWDLYKVTGDTAFVQALYRANDNSTEGLPYELTIDDPSAFRKAVGDVIARVGTEIPLGSVNKQEWHVAILRSGKNENARALWVNYEAGGGHGHADGMNLGLFAKGLDLMPDFGYPAVNFGGWESPRANWYRMTAAHNTVTVDGRNQLWAPGKTTLWADGKGFRAIRASCPAMIGGSQYERTAALVDISDRDSYVLDLFRVVGGTEHSKFMGSYFGSIATSGLTLGPVQEYGRGAQLRDFRLDESPKPGWSVDWKVEDKYKFLAPGSDVHLRYTDLTDGAAAATAEAWIIYGGYATNNETWVPRVMSRRMSKEAPLASTFVSVIEPYEKRSNITSIRRLALETLGGKPYSGSNVAVEVTLAAGRRDLIVATDIENPLALSPSVTEHKLVRERESGLLLDGELCQVRFRSNGQVERIALCHGRSVSVGDVTLKLKAATELFEVSFKDGRPRIETGKPEDVESLVVSKHVAREGSESNRAGASAFLPGTHPEHVAERNAGPPVVVGRSNTMKLQANYYQQFDADLGLDVPGEGYGGWKKAEIELSPEHTALVVMHAWESGTPEKYPGWYRAVEYIPREQEICRSVFPKLLAAVRASGMKVFHVVGGGDYYKSYPGYKKTVALAGRAPKAPEQITPDAALTALQQFRAANVFVGPQNEADVAAGFAKLDFAPEAKPFGDEGIAENDHQLSALCKKHGINHLVYAGFAVNWCLLMSPGGMLDMSRRGVMCSTIRQATTAVENRETARRQLNKEEALWRIALAFGFVFDLDDFMGALRS